MYLLSLYGSERIYLTSMTRHPGSASSMWTVRITIFLQLSFCRLHLPSAVNKLCGCSEKTESSSHLFDTSYPSTPFSLHLDDFSPPPHIPVLVPLVPVSWAHERHVTSKAWTCSQRWTLGVSPLFWTFHRSGPYLRVFTEGKMRVWPEMHSCITINILLEVRPKQIFRDKSELFIKPSPRHASKIFLLMFLDRLINSIIWLLRFIITNIMSTIAQF